MPKQGVVSIGLNVDYQKSLNQMMNDFKAKLSTISNEAKKLDFSKDITKQIGAVDEKIERISSDFRAMFDEINSQKLDASKFEAYQLRITKDFEKVEKSISVVVSEISALDEKIGMLSGADFASSMKKQFDDLRESVLSTYQGLEKVFDLTKSSPSGLKGGIDSSALKDYKATVAEIRKAQKEVDNLDFSGSGDDDLFDKLSREEELLNKQITTFKELKAEMSSVSTSSPEFSTLENNLVRVQSAISKTSETIQELDREIAARNLGAGMEDDTLSIINSVKHFDDEIDNFVVRTQKMIEANKEAQNSVEQTQTAFNTFQIKNGAIHVPVEVATKSGTLQKQLQETIDKLQEYAQKNSIIAKVKLTLDGGSASGYKKNDDIAKQLEDGQNEPSVDISKAIKKTYVQAVREAEKTAKDSIKAIQAIFDGSPIKITPNKDAFTEELSTMVNSSLGKISEDTTGLSVNSELEKLVNNLKEVSTSLSGNENFKFGLDEASIERITAAIKNMADMIQRAFGVASNDDISAQWSAIESKFKAVAGEEGKLLKGNKEHKAAIQELAVEYKKYLDMGGKNNLSELTAHKQTVKNVATEYENLGKAAQEAAQQQEKVAKKPASKKVSSEEAEAIKGVTRENKKLETQAGKTGTALDNEAKSAQSAAEKFRKLAKEKGAAVVANRELAKAAKETADALEREAKARKSGTGKTNKNAIDEGVYSSNFLKWQSDIESSLRDSGNYADVYEAKISQATNGTVKFTAVVRTLDGDLKKFSAGVNDIGGIFSPSVSEMGEKQAADFEKRLKIAEKVREAISAMDGEGVEPIRLNREQLEGYVDAIQKILQSLGDANTTYKLDLTDNGKLSIVRKEISKTGAETKSFTAVIDRVDDLFEETADGVVVSAKKIQDALAGAFDSGKASKSTKDLAASARKAFDVFKEKAARDDNFSAIESDLENLKQQIAGIKTSEDLVKFNQDLKDLGVTLKDVGKDNKLGKIIDENKTFGNINEVRANIDSLFASMGKVNEKSIRVTGTNKLTAEVKAANGEIRKMNVSLDSKGFARYVDAGIVQFGRLRSAAEGVFKGIQSMVRIYLSPQDFIRYFRQGFDAVREIDTAMTELKKVSDAPMGDIVAYFDDAVESAKELGSTVNDMIAATADWSRMGYNLPDSRELGEVAVLYKNVGDGIDIDTANESLVSTIQGFQLQASDAMSVIDAFNEVSNNYAINSAGIGEALKRSAAAFNAANTDLNQSIALITAGNEIVQSPEKVGTMWQTVSARIRGKICAHCTVMCRPPYEDNIKAA